MGTIELLQSNLLSPMVLAFVLGLLAVAVRSDLKFPQELYTGLSIFLLMAIGLKGGHELAHASLASVVRPAAATLLAGALIPVVVFALLRTAGGFGVADAAALAAHYGSVSAVSFAATLTFLDTKNVPYEGFMPALVAMMEVPAIVVALLLSRVFSRPADGEPRRVWGRVLHEVFAGRSVVLLLGGLAIGYVSTDKNFDRVAPAFVNLFYGALVLFLLDMGMVAAKRLREIGQAGPFLVAFAVLMPVANGFGGVLLGHWAGLGVGGTTVFGVLCASASYIAAPAAVRVALPQANPAFYLTASIGLTFPFNLTAGIPLIYGMAKWASA